MDCVQGLDKALIRIDSRQRIRKVANDPLLKAMVRREWDGMRGKEETGATLKVSKVPRPYARYADTQIRLTGKPVENSRYGMF